MVQWLRLIGWLDDVMGKWIRLVTNPFIFQRKKQEIYEGTKTEAASQNWETGICCFLCQQSYLHCVIVDVSKRGKDKI